MTRVSIADDIRLIEDLIKGASAEDAASLEKQHVERVCRRLAKNVGPKELASIVAAVNSSNLSQAAGRALINTALEAHGKCSKSQTMSCYECYLTVDLLARYKADQIALKLKFIECIDHLLALNARWLTENSYKHVACVVLMLALGSTAALAMDPRAVKGIVDELKVNVRNRVKRNPQFVGGVPADYPPDLDAFKRDFPEVYNSVFQQSPPARAADMGIQMACIYQMQNQCGCRRNSKKIGQAQTLETASSAAMHLPQQSQLVNTLVGLVAQMAQPQGRGNGLPALLDLQSPRRSRSPLSLRSMTSTPRKVEELQPSADEAEGDNKKDSPSDYEEAIENGNDAAIVAVVSSDDEPTSKPSDITWLQMVATLDGKPSKKSIKRKSDAAASISGKPGVVEQDPNVAPTMDADRKPVYWRGGAILTGKVRNEFVVFWSRGDRKDYRFKFDASSKESMQQAWGRAVMKMMENPSYKPGG